MNQKRIIILTGNEQRHTYFRKTLANDNRIEVLTTFCESADQSLAARTAANESASTIEHQHVAARTQSEQDFFKEVTTNTTDHSKPIVIDKGAINDPEITEKIISLNPDILICYGSSLIKTELLERFSGRFINVHLGLSPYYRGSGTNVWPLINNEPNMVGATFMYIDAGIDTGRIIHQIQADIFLGDSPHSIGNRLIRKMTYTYADLVARFDQLTDERQPDADGKLYKIKDFDAQACTKLYQNFREGMIEHYLASHPDHLQADHLQNAPYLVVNQGLKQSLKGV